MNRQTHRSLAAAVLAVALTACGGTAQVGQPRPVPAGQDHGTHALPAADPTGGHPWTEADVRFMTQMIGHHAQAVEMARLAPSRGASPQVQTLAARIISSQEDEMATMRQWLRDRGQPVPDAHAHHQHGAAMPGMLTAEQMAQLEQARGEAFDRLFLSLMIQHHRGAVQMVSQLFGSYGAGQDETVFKFASDVNVDQETEIARMQRMLEALLFAGPSQ